MLHLHIMIWLKHVPNANEMHILLKSEEFQAHVVAYIQVNIKAHLDNFDENTVKTMKHENELGYSHLLDPDSPNWTKEAKELEHFMVCLQQVHMCTQSACLVFEKKTGKLVCKC